MDFATLCTLAAGMPAEIAILMRGPTGVGKSQVARKIAADLALPYIDVRASTMDEASATRARPGSHQSSVVSWTIMSAKPRWMASK